MENKLLLSAQKPLLVSRNSPFNEKSYLSVKSRLPMSTIRAARSQFMGEGLILGNKYGFWSASRKTRVVVEPVRAAMKRRKELTFDNVVQRDKKLKLVLNIRKILVSQPDRMMSLRGLGKYRRDLGLKKRRRFIALLRKYPGVNLYMVLNKHRDVGSKSSRMLYSVSVFFKHMKTTHFSRTLIIILKYAC